MNKISDKTKGLLAASITVLIWGTTFVATKILLRSFEPEEIIFTRFLLGYGFLWILGPKRWEKKSLRREAIFAAAGLTGVTLNYLLEAYALLYTQAGNLAVIVSISPLITGILAAVILRRKLTVPFIVSFCLSMIGVVLISLADSGEFQFHLIGDMLGVAIALVWAVYSLLTEQLGDEGENVILYTRRIFFWGLIFMIPILLKNHGSWNPAGWLEGTNLLILIGLSFLACAVSYIMWNYAVRTLGAVRTNTFLYVQPIVTILFSAIFLQETFTARMAVGTILILVGLLLAQKTTGYGKEEGGKL